jgi:nucleotide-binding universal stress UspA family protein
MGMKLKLVGCERYNFRGELYERGKVYLVGDQKAELMLRSVDEFDRPYFAEYRKPLKSEAQRKAEEAAAAALAAAQAEEAEELVERPDDSGDAAPEVEVSESEEIDMIWTLTTKRTPKRSKKKIATTVLLSKFKAGHNSLWRQYPYGYCLFYWRP